MLSNLFRPISLVWSFLYSCRRILYRYNAFAQNDFVVPVISIGNLTFGGTGKTPFTIYLSKWLSKKNIKIMVATRGYKSQHEKGRAIIFSDRKMSLDSSSYGDEPTLITRKTNNTVVVIGRDRVSNIKYYLPLEKPDIILLDDGYQHLKIKRNFNIVLFNALMDEKKYQTAPSGLMRESFSALYDADFVIIGRVDQASEKQVRNLEDKIRPSLKEGTPIGEICYRPIGFFDGYYNLCHELVDLKGRNVLAVSALAHNESFFKTLEGLGLNLIEKKYFSDHYTFTPRDIKELLEISKEQNLIIIVSEKDIVKIRQISKDPRILFLEIEIEFKKGQKEFESCLLKNI